MLEGRGDVGALILAHRRQATAPWGAGLAVEGTGTSARFDRRPRDGRSSAITPGSRGGGRDILVQAENVALGIVEPRGLLGAEHADVPDRLEPRQIVVGEDHAPALQLG